MRNPSKGTRAAMNGYLLQVSRTSRLGPASAAALQPNHSNAVKSFLPSASLLSHRLNPDTLPTSSALPQHKQNYGRECLRVL